MAKAKSPAAIAREMYAMHRKRFNNRRKTKPEQLKCAKEISYALFNAGWDESAPGTALDIYDLRTTFDKAITQAEGKNDFDELTFLKLETQTAERKYRRWERQHAVITDILIALYRNRNGNYLDTYDELEPARKKISAVKDAAKEQSDKYFRQYMDYDTLGYRYRRARQWWQEKEFDEVAVK